MKQLLGLAAFASAFVPSVFAQDNEALTVYGRANVSLQSIDEGSGSETDVVSHSSRFGFKGATELESDLDVFYQLEFGVDLGDTKDDAITNRNQVVGLRGNFGKIMIGRYDTFLKDSQGSIDQFKDYEADIKSLFRGENRPDNTVTYYSPDYYNLSFGVTYIASESDNIDDGVSFGVLYGDEKLKTTPVYAALAVDRDVAGYDVEQFSVYTKAGDVKIGAALQQFESVNGLYDGEGYMLSAAYPIGNWVLKGQYQSIDESDDSDASFSVGADYHFSKKTRVYTWYTGRDCNIGTYTTRGCNGARNVEQDYLAIGIRHDFSW